MNRIIEWLISLMRTMAVLMLGIRAGQGQFAFGIEAFVPVASIIPIAALIVVLFFPAYMLWDWIDDYLERKEPACSAK